ncbi:MAG: type II toxin-antitoxin system RelE/ParE family toxin [Youngiibacter sp.]|nr:type II toxin-antitoxin system RelE/ParE family toxin [Youngiibacter sp.]
MNKKYNIEYLPVAEEDLKNIFEYILNDSPASALKILEMFDKAVTRLSYFPYLGTVPKDPGLTRMKYRFLVVDTFLVFYKVIEETESVEIRRILNSKQDYDLYL